MIKDIDNLVHILEQLDAFSSIEVFDVPSCNMQKISLTKYGGKKYSVDVTYKDEHTVIIDIYAVKSSTFKFFKPLSEVKHYENESNDSHFNFVIESIVDYFRL